jgi:hypothetical protein
VSSALGVAAAATTAVTAVVVAAAVAAAPRGLARREAAAPDQAADLFAVDGRRQRRAAAECAVVACAAIAMMILVDLLSPLRAREMPPHGRRRCSCAHIIWCCKPSGCLVLCVLCSESNFNQVRWRVKLFVESRQRLTFLETTLMLCTNKKKINA